MRRATLLLTLAVALSNCLAASPATRAIQFDTDEGTWMSLDVSADAKTLTFDLLGDVYVLPASGGDARALTSNMGFNAQPRFSPDGKWITFISDRSGSDNLWVMHSDGSEPHQLTHDNHVGFTSPTFTPEGDGILVSRLASYYDATYELWWYGLSGGAGFAVTKSASTPDTPKDRWDNAVGVTASHDGRFLYYAHAPGVVSGAFNPTGAATWEIIRRDRLTGQESVIVRPLGGAMRPVVSPQGDWLVYGSRFRGNTELRLRDLRTGEDRRLLSAIQRDNHESSHPILDLLPGYAVTKDGRWLYAAWEGHIHRVDIQRGTVTDVPMRAHVEQLLGDRPSLKTPLGDGEVNARLIRHATLSPDGSRVAFTAFARVYVMSLPSGKPQEIAAATGAVARAQPEWSPDGRRLSYVTWHPQEGGAVWVVDLAGHSSPKSLTHDAAYYKDPAWSPDGKSIIALRQSGFAHRVLHHVDNADYSDAVPDSLDMPEETNNLVRLSLNGTIQRIATVPHATRPHFAAGDQCLYLSTAEGLKCVTGPDIPPRPIVTVKTRSVMGRDMTNNKPVIQLNPDGRTLAILSRSQLYVAKMPRLGEPLILDPESPSLPLVQLTRFGADEFTWSQGGKTLVWTLGATVFSRDITTLDWSAKQDAAHQTALDLKITRPRFIPHGTVIFEDAKVVSLRGPHHDEVIVAADVVVTDGRISTISPHGGPLPVGAKVIDAKGMTIVPGFVDLHPHWAFSAMGLRTEVLDLAAPVLANYLAYGVTTGRDPQSAIDVFEYADLVETGAVTGPRLLSTGPGIFGELDLKSPEQTLDVLTRYAKYYGVTTIKSYLVGDRQQRQWVMQAARQLGLMPTMEGGDNFPLQLTHVQDGFSGIEHNVPIAPLEKDVVQLLAASGTAYDPVLLETYGGSLGFSDYYQDPGLVRDSKANRLYPADVLESRTRRSQWTNPLDRFLPAAAASAARVLREGGLVCVGSHGDFAGLGYQWNLWALADGGLTPLQALQAATVNGAQALGLQDEVGSLGEGMRADFLVLGADPLQDIRNTASIRYVVKGGVVYDGATADRMWPDHRLHRTPTRANNRGAGNPIASW